MAFWIKNCGLKTPETIEKSVATGATHIGLMHHEASPRHVTIEEGAILRPLIPSSLTTVAVLVAPTNKALDTLVESWTPDALQIHGIHDAEHLRKLNERYDLPIILAISVTSAEDIELANRIAVAGNVHSILLDASKAGMHGGTGHTFDWTLLKHTRPALPWLLAGGLTPENVSEAIECTQPNGVDVSSGIESAKGIKSLEKIAAFNAAVLSSPHVIR